MSRKSQVDKFNAKLSKKSVDEDAVNTRTYQKKQEDLRIYGAEGVDELMSQGNIKEAAVVFSREGMGAFANMFGNSMESAVVRVLDNHIGKITQTMEERMEAIIEAKMLQMLEGMTEGMKQFQAQQAKDAINETIQSTDSEILNQLRDIFPGIQKATLMEEPQFPNVPVYEPKKEIEPIETPVIDWGKAFEIDRKEKEAKANPQPEPLRAKKIKEKGRPAIADAPRPKKSDYFSDVSFEGIEGLVKPDKPAGYRFGQSIQDIAVVAPFVLSLMKKYADTEILSATILKVLKSEYGITFVNPTIAFRKIMTLDPNFENVGFGVYKYGEKNFKPTV